jgi:hypothetical protein
VVEEISQEEVSLEANLRRDAVKKYNIDFFKKFASSGK